MSLKMDLSKHLHKLEPAAAAPVDDAFVSIAIKSSLRARLRRAAAERDMRFGEFVNQALEAALK
jgi:hypothetical protein